MNTMLTINEMQEQFKSEWVLIENPETVEHLEIKGGKVLWHSKNRDEVYKKARELAPKHSAIIYTGAISDETAIIL